MDLFKKGDKVVVNAPQMDVFDAKGKIVQKVTKNIPISGQTGMRSGDWYLVDFGGYDGVLKIHQSKIVKEGKEMPSIEQAFEQAMKTINESRKPGFKGFKSSKPSLKTEGNEDITLFSLNKLSFKQIEAALENAGYYDNGITSARFVKTITNGGSFTFLYNTKFYDEVEGETQSGEVYVSINKDGYIVGEPGGSA